MDLSICCILSSKQGFIHVGGIEVEEGDNGEVEGGEGI